MDQLTLCTLYILRAVSTLSSSQEVEWSDLVTYLGGGGGGGGAKNTIKG